MNRSWQIIGAVLAVVGFLLAVVMQAIHPGGADPNDSVAAFEEYAAYGPWTLVHIGQFFGALLMAVSLATAGRALAGTVRSAAVFAAAGGAMALLSVAVFAVQMAVDGVALQAASGRWLQSPPAEQAAAFAVAESVRDLEKGLSGFFHVLNGMAFLGAAAAAVVSDRARWLVALGALAAAGFIAGGAVTAETGFSATAGRVLLPATALGLSFLVGAYVLLLRRPSATAVRG